MENSRKHTRIEYEEPVRARCASWPDFLQLYTENISHGGLFIRHDEPPEDGTELVVEIEMPDGSMLKLEARVVHAMTAEEAKEKGVPMGFGVEFFNVTQEQVTLLATLVKTAEQHATAPPPPLPPPPKG